MSARTVRRGALWLLLYVGLLFAPLAVLVSGLVHRPGSGWWFDFAMGLGFAALALMAGQFLLTARFRRATSPFGIDVVYQFHRWLAIGGLALVVGHYLVLRVGYSSTLRPWQPTAAPFHMTAGRIALALFAVLVVSSLWRKALRIGYDGWRVAHAVMATAAVALTLMHLRGAGYYTDVLWSRTVIDLLGASLVAVVAYVRVVKPIWTSARPFRVASVRAERGDSWTLRLEPDGHEGMSFMPGQFGWLSLGRAPWRAGEHPFSFSSAPADSGQVEMTIKELGDFTRTVRDTREGTVAYVDGPHGVFSVDLYPNAPGFFFLAGGIGIAPIVSMLRALARRGDRRPLWLVFGNARAERATFLEEIEALRARLDLRFTHVVQEPPEGWTGEVGLPTPELIERTLAAAPEGIHCFLCGPVPMSRMAQRALRDVGVPIRRVHFELFDMA